MSTTSVPAATGVPSRPTAPAPGGTATVEPLGPADRRPVARWELIGGVVIFLVGGFLHFLYELSGFTTIAAPFGSVNESTWEHLKLFFWAGAGFAVVEHAYLRHRVRNFWAAKGTAAIATMLGVVVSFYAYVGVIVPLGAKGTLLGTLVTAVIGIAIGQVLAYRLLVGPERGPRARLAGIAALVALGVAFIAFTFSPPRLFLFEDFLGYRYTGGFGILADYTNYLVFR